MSEDEMLKAFDEIKEEVLDGYYASPETGLELRRKLLAVGAGCTTDELVRVMKKWIQINDPEFFKEKCMS
jgi:hypothetical protein